MPASGAAMPAPGRLVYASFWQRVAAQLIDALWMLPLAFGLAVIGSALRGGEDLSTGGEIMLNVICGLVVVIYWASRQATPGKRALGLRIVDADTGGTPPVGRLVARYLGYIVSGAPLGLGYLWMLWDDRSQTWHDKVAATLVVHDIGNGPRLSTDRFG
jgi:uncharacterized RDD family membrane protein YckC